nr:leucine-rich repeat-containing protein 47-like [Ciona intestinalis]|eukprot:XP_002131295.1 leucine-rich repeat-containing protein 47-like [Ciona intestinalis]
MSYIWSEIKQAKEEQRRELVLKGPELKKKVDDADGCLPDDLYELSLLNFLEVNSLGVKCLNPKLENLQNLSQLFLRQNLLTEIPACACNIITLKILDLSQNALTLLPQNLGNLVNLQTLNVAHNSLSDVPESAKALANLAVLDISTNKFTELPYCLFELPLSARLAEIHASHNAIEDVKDEIEEITMLKVFDLSNNQLNELTKNIGYCLKLKQVNFKSNPLKDRRLRKLVDQDSSQKSIMDYIRSKGRQSKKKESKSKNVNEKQTAGKGARKKLKDQKAQEAENIDELIKCVIEVLKVEEQSTAVPENFRVVVYEEAREVRPFIVCCILRGLTLDTGDKYKNFITLQTRLHDEVCGKRTIATIATHDMSALKTCFVEYDAQPPNTFKIHPLGRKAAVGALEFYKRLCSEAENMRKDKKRNQVSGIHKYLSMLKDQEQFAFLRRSSDDCIISLPPLTNCDATKISPESTDIFVEVTGTKSLRSCKDVLDEFLKRLVELGCYSTAIKTNKEKDFYDDSSDEENTENPNHTLVVQQVRVEDEKGDVRVVYPAKTDLLFDTKEIKILRYTEK